MSPAFLTWQMGWKDLPSLGEQVGWSTDRNAGESTQQTTALAPGPDDSGHHGRRVQPLLPPRCLSHSPPIPVVATIGSYLLCEGCSEGFYLERAGAGTHPCAWLLALQPEVTKEAAAPAGTGAWRPREQRPREGAAGLPEAFWTAGVGCWHECPGHLGVTGGERNLEGSDSFLWGPRESRACLTYGNCLSGNNPGSGA